MDAAAGEEFFDPVAEVSWGDAGAVITWGQTNY